ncbi:hypothetical protein HGRIS_002519 [Hohenbuehelia grisea]|uniref:Uncharacterized protein n=1 Tax=Hohenbuehelia grisea TaxID=104357 RepID=A0ABR3JLY6_9AGAR
MHVPNRHASALASLLFGSPNGDGPRTTLPRSPQKRLRAACLHSSRPYIPSLDRFALHIKAMAAYTETMAAYDTKYAYSVPLPISMDPFGPTDGHDVPRARSARKQGNGRRNKLAMASIESSPSPPTSFRPTSIQLITTDSHPTSDSPTRRKHPRSPPRPLEFPAMSLSVSSSESSITYASDHFTKYMTTFPEQSFRVQLRVPTARPGTAKSWRPAGEETLPNQLQIESAALVPVIDENGQRIPFGDLWKRQKTIAIFIRHFWCPLCQDYMYSITRSVSPDVLKRAGIKLVIISNGSHKMIKSYRKIFHTPFSVYTDPSHRLYDAFGMKFEHADEGVPGSYVRHGLMGGIAMVVGNALRVGMPIWENGGDIKRLGGEFILGPGLTCSFAHRMKTTRSHMPIIRLIKEAGVDISASLSEENVTFVEKSSTQRPPSIAMSEEEEADWMRMRRQSLTALKARKMQRRGGTQWCGGITCPTPMVEDIEARR